LIPPKVTTFIAAGKVKQELHQFVMFQYFNDLRIT
jgi:hypothetical protein